MKEQIKRTQDQIKNGMVRQKINYDKNLHHTPYSKGELVMCRHYACKPGLKPKLMLERWTGPWRVDQVRGPVNYRIVHGKKRMLVHYNRLKPHVNRPPNLSKEPAVEINVQEKDEAVCITEIPLEDEVMFQDPAVLLQRPDILQREEPVPHGCQLRDRRNIRAPERLNL